jgi:hypothetical protein
VLHRLVYSSAAAPGFGPEDVEEMLVEWRTRNRAHGISGVLIFVEGVFLQVLEGEQDDVLDLMGRIEQDPRHHDVRVFLREDVADRAFPTWSMAYVTPDAGEVARWARLEGASTMEAVMASIEREPDRLPPVLLNILRAIAAQPS